MSLAQHVSSIEGADRHGMEDNGPADFQPSKALRQVLSYDVLPPDIVRQVDNVAAYKVSATKRAGKTVGLRCIHPSDIA
jgi:hypothetical protein